MKWHYLMIFFLILLTQLIFAYKTCVSVNVCVHLKQLRFISIQLFTNNRNLNITSEPFYWYLCIIT